jgi:hypothetical protein
VLLRANGYRLGSHHQKGQINSVISGLTTFTQAKPVSFDPSKVTARFFPSSSQDNPNISNSEVSGLKMSQLKQVGKLLHSKK